MLDVASREPAPAVAPLIKPISYRDVLASPMLLEAHYEELATDKNLMELAPDVATYEVLDHNGALFTLGVLLGDELVGYSANLVHPSLHYSRLRLCENDVLYLKPEHRSLGLGRALLAATRAEGRQRGAAMMIWHAKPNTALHALLQAEGLRVQDILFSEAL